MDARRIAAELLCFCSSGLVSASLWLSVARQVQASAAGRLRPTVAVSGRSTLACVDAVQLLLQAKPARLQRGFAFGLNLEGMLGMRTDCVDSVGQTAGCLDVVVLDQNAVAEIKDMIMRTADSHRVFLQHSEAWPSFAGIGDSSGVRAERHHVLTVVCGVEWTGWTGCL